MKTKLILLVSVLFSGLELSASKIEYMDCADCLHVKGERAFFKAVDIVLTPKTSIVSDGGLRYDGVLLENSSPEKNQTGWLNSTLHYLKLQLLGTREGSGYKPIYEQAAIKRILPVEKYRMPPQSPDIDLLKNWTMTANTKIGHITHTPEWIIMPGFKVYRVEIEGRFINNIPLSAPLILQVHMSRQDFLNAIGRAGLEIPTTVEPQLEERDAGEKNLFEGGLRDRGSQTVLINHSYYLAK